MTLLDQQTHQQFLIIQLQCNYTVITSNYNYNTLMLLCKLANNGIQLLLAIKTLCLLVLIKLLMVRNLAHME